MVRCQTESINNTDNTSASVNSANVESASELDLAFLENSDQTRGDRPNSPTLSLSPPSCRHLPPPPPHPLIANLDDSAIEFYTPSAIDKSPIEKKPNLEDGVPTELQPSIQERRKAVRRTLTLDCGELLTLTDPLEPGEVDSEAVTPTPQSYDTIEICEPNLNSYLAKGPDGQLAIPRIPASSLAGTRGDHSEIENLATPLDPDVPSTSTGRTALRTKIRPKDNRTRPANDHYPQSRVNDINGRISAAQASNSTEDRTSRLQRGPDGRFLKRPT